MEAQPNKVRRGNEEIEEDPYTYQLDRELREELKRRMFRVSGRKREEMILLLKEDDRTQGKIVMGIKHKGGQGGGKHLRERDKGKQEEEREEDATPVPREEEEDNWVDMKPADQGANGKRTEGAASTKQSLRRTSPLKCPGRLKGRKGRGAWMGRKEDLIKGRTKSGANRGEPVNRDSKSKGRNRVKWEENSGIGTGPGHGLDPLSSPGSAKGN